MTERRIAYDPEVVIGKLAAQLAEALARCARLESALANEPEPAAEES